MLKSARDRIGVAPIKSGIRGVGISKLIIVLLIFLGSGTILLVLHTRLQKIEKRAASNPTSVTFSVPRDREAVVERLIQLFKDMKASQAGRFRRFLVGRPTDEYFPKDFQLRHYANDPFLRKYINTTPALRKEDFYLYDFSDADNPESYWPSEYYLKGEPARFRCDFIIHIEPEGESSTKIEVLEYVPRVWAGEKLALGRHGLGTFLDIRDVEPTTTDRIELANLIKEALR